MARELATTTDTRWQTWLSSLLMVALLTATAAAQAPRHGPPPHSLWTHTGRKVQPVSAHELWGDVYCSGGHMCLHRDCCGPLHCTGKAILRALDCLFPCSHCGATTACDCTARPAPRRRCCLPSIPSVRFHPIDCGPPGGCCDHPAVMEGEPMLVEPPVPQPTADPSSAAHRPRSRRVAKAKKATTIKTRLRQPPSLQPAKLEVKQKSEPIHQPVSFEKVESTPEQSNRAAKKSDGAAVPNPLRPAKRR